MDAIRTMTLMSAQMLERSTPSARFKGRLHGGTDADVVVFNPETVGDRSTYQHPMAASILSFSQGQNSKSHQNQDV
jgi:hypothetical protein